LHQGDFLGEDKLLEMLVEFGELRMLGDGVQRLMVAVIFLIFPNVD